jgi:hypothetical protein
MDLTIDGTLFLLEETLSPPLLTISLMDGNEVTLPLEQVLMFVDHLRSDAPHLVTASAPSQEPR